MTHHSIVIKLYCYHLSINIFLKHDKKTRNYHQKEVLSYNGKTTAFEDRKLPEQQSGSGLQHCKNSMIS